MSTHPNTFSCLINHSRFRNPPVAPKRIFAGPPRACLHRTLTRFRAFGTIWYQRQVLACNLRNACTRRDAGTHSRTSRNSKPRNATRPVRRSSFTGQRTPLSHRYRGCHLLRHWPNHSEKPIDRGPIHFFSSNEPGGHVFLSAVPLSEPRS